jgi:regulator of sigma E protease
MTGIHILEFILIMIVLVILHEMGHMVVAKWCGMRVERFSVFFGRPLWSFTKGETQYGVGWLPLGGYVKITGMSREELFDREYDAEGRMISETPVAPEIAARAYCNSTTPRKVATILAGPMANVLVAIVLFAVSFWVGYPRYESSATISTVSADTPAAIAGLRPDDRLTQINALKVYQFSDTQEANVEAARKVLQTNVGKPVTLKVLRDGAMLTIVTPPLAADPADPTIGRLGITFRQDKVGVDRQGVFEGLGSAVRFTGFLTKEQTLALGKLVTGDKEVRDQVQGPIGMGATYNDFAGEGWGTILRFAGIISLILAIMNLIPLLPLDGGHIVFALAERIRGRHLSLAVYQRASIIGIGIVLVLAFFGFSNDITRLTGSGFTP